MRNLMKLALVAILAFAAQLAHAAPLCTPASPLDVRIGVSYNPDGSAAGAWAYWWCTTNGTVDYEWRAAPASSFTAAVLSQLRAYSTGANAAFVNTPTTLLATDPVLTLMKADIVKAVAADTGKPVITPDIWRTPATGTFTLYKTAAGKLSGVISGRRTSANQLLDCSVKVMSGASTYCPLATGPATEVTLAKKVAQ